MKHGTLHLCVVKTWLSANKRGQPIWRGVKTHRLLNTASTLRQWLVTLLWLHFIKCKTRGQLQDTWLITCTDITSISIIKDEEELKPNHNKVKQNPETAQNWLLDNLLKTQPKLSPKNLTFRPLSEAFTRRSWYLYVLDLNPNPRNKN